MKRRTNPDATVAKQVCRWIEQAGREEIKVGEGYNYDLTSTTLVRGVSRNPGRGVLTCMLSMNGVWSCMQLVGRSSRRLGSVQLYRAYCTSDQLQQRRCFRASSFL